MNFRFHLKGDEHTASRLRGAWVPQAHGEGWRIRYGEGRRSVTDGPFAETKELIAGYTLIQVRSREEAMEWSRRFPNPHGESANAEIEVRRLYEPADLPF